jgi:uncharacterized phage-associated protein
MAYFAAQIANEFISRGKRDGISVEPLKLQKLVYLAHGWHLAFLARPLIQEKVKAWKYGPVVPSLYRELKGHGACTISEPLAIPSNASPLDNNAIAIIDEVWLKYGRMGGLTLSMLTHEPGFAWDLVRRGNEGNLKSPPIPDSYIRDEFERRRAKT